jgi:hypothetical protein
VGGALGPAREADRGVAARGAEGLDEEPEEVAPAGARRAVPLHEDGHVREEVALPEGRALDEALRARVRPAQKWLSEARGLRLRGLSIPC